MKRALLICLLLPLFGWSQVLQYSPNRKLEKTVSQTYYDTEFIFIENISGSPITLEFEVIENTLLPDWSATICTNAQCFNQIPKSSSLGSIGSGSEAYFSFNFAANETVGEGQIRFLITSPTNQELKDTVTFKYAVTEDGSVKAGPWANINFAQGVLTVLLENPHLETNMQVYNVEGKLIYDQTLEHITSVPLRSYPNGAYIVIIRDENDRILREKLVKYQ